MTTTPTPSAYLYTTPSGARVVDLKRVDLDTPGLTISDLIAVEQAQAYADARVREALESAANEPQAHIKQLEREGWIEEWPDELDLLHTFGGSISKRIRSLIPTDPRPGQP